MATIELEGLVEQFTQGHNPKADGCASGRHGDNHEGKGEAVSTAALSVRAGATAAATAPSRGRCARALAASDHRKGGKHRLGVGALALGAHLALVATGKAAKDVEGVPAAQAGELVDGHPQYCKDEWGKKYSATPSCSSIGTAVSISLARAPWKRS